MRGVVVFSHEFLVSCPYRFTSYHALESATTAILGGYNAAVMDRHKQLNEMRHCPLYHDVKSSGDLSQAITKMGAKDSYIGTNILFASDEWAASESAAWARIGDPNGVVISTAMNWRSKTATFEVKLRICNPVGLTFKHMLPASLFPRWKKGDKAPRVRLNVEWSPQIGRNHPFNFFGRGRYGMPPVYQAHKVASFAIRITPVDSLPTDKPWPAQYIEAEGPWTGLSPLKPKEDKPLRFSRLILAIMSVWDGTYSLDTPMTADTFVIYRDQVDTPATKKVLYTTSTTMIDVRARLDQLAGRFDEVSEVLGVDNIFSAEVNWDNEDKGHLCPIGCGKSIKSYASALAHLFLGHMLERVRANSKASCQRQVVNILDGSALPGAPIVYYWQQPGCMWRNVGWSQDSTLASQTLQARVQWCKTGTITFNDLRTGDWDSEDDNHKLLRRGKGSGNQESITGCVSSRRRVDHG